MTLCDHCKQPFKRVNTGWKAAGITVYTVMREDGRLALMHKRCAHAYQHGQKKRAENRD